MTINKIPLIFNEQVLKHMRQSKMHLLQTNPLRSAPDFTKELKICVICGTKENMPICYVANS